VDSKVQLHKSALTDMPGPCSIGDDDLSLYTDHILVRNHKPALILLPTGYFLCVAVAREGVVGEESDAMLHGCRAQSAETQPPPSRS